MDQGTHNIYVVRHKLAYSTGCCRSFTKRRRNIVFTTDELKSHPFLVHFFDLFLSKKD